VEVRVIGVGAALQAASARQSKNTNSINRNPGYLDMLGSIIWGERIKTTGLKHTPLLIISL
jgi:hypothetical protein